MGNYLLQKNQIRIWTPKKQNTSTNSYEEHKSFDLLIFARK